MRILARKYGVIQGLDFLLGFDFPTWVVEVDVRLLLKQEMRRDMFGSAGRFPIFNSTFLAKQNQSTPLRRHLANVGMTGW